MKLLKFLRNALARRVAAAATKISTERKGLRSEIPELSDEAEQLLDQGKTMSMTSPIAQWEFIEAIRYIEARERPADIIKCGVWPGANLALAGILRPSIGFDRQIWAYDTFAGMTAPTGYYRKANADVDVKAKFEQLERAITTAGATRRMRTCDETSPSARAPMRRSGP